VLLGMVEQTQARDGKDGQRSGAGHFTDQNLGYLWKVDVLFRIRIREMKGGKL